MALTKLTSYDILDGTLTDADVAAANKDGLAAVPSMRTIGTSAVQACAGNDSRLSNDRTASGIRTATTVVAVSPAAAPSAGQVLQATSDAAAEWVTLDIQSTADLIENEVPTGTVDGTNAEFVLANTPVAGSVKLYKNGLRMKEGAGVDFTRATVTITFAAGQIPQTGDELVCDYRK
jgi:hypothetical protein